MDIKSEIGRIVWHDLMTGDVAGAQRFYGELLGWDYQVEQAREFVWGHGAAGYPLIFANGEAHGGIINQIDPGSSFWLAYVVVAEVDAAVAIAEVLGASVERQPFDIRGVGRAALIRDRKGAAICPYTPAHAFPAPSGTFLWDELVTGDIPLAKIFYGELFGWSAEDIDPSGEDYTMFKRADDTSAAGAMTRPFVPAGQAAWFPYLATRDVDLAVEMTKLLGGAIVLEAMDIPTVGRIAIVADPGGARFGLLAAET